MVNLHIGGGISVFLFCVSLLVCDQWFNRGAGNNNLSQSNGNELKVSSEFVSIPPRIFFFTQEPRNNVSDGVFFPRDSWADDAGSWADNFQPTN